MVFLMSLALAAPPVHPEHSLFLPSADPSIPHPGQEHPQGHLGRKSRLMWIPMWTQNDVRYPETLVRTVPVTLPAGPARAVVEVWHHAPKGKHLLTVRIHTPSGTVEHAVAASHIRGAYDGGFQTVVLPFDSDKSGDVSVEIIADGKRRVHIGAVRLTDDKPRPFWMFAHCVHTVNRIERAARTGANAVELDIGWERGALVIVHPAPRPYACWAESSRNKEIAPFFAALGEYTRGSEAPFALVSLDVKDPGKNTEAYASALARALTEGGVPPEKTMLMAPWDEALPFAEAMRKAGYDLPHIDGYHDLMAGKRPDDWVQQSVDRGATFVSIGVDPIAFWHPMPSSAEPLKQEIDQRDHGGPPYYAYFWTVERRPSFRFAMDAGVDAVIANHPRHLLTEVRRAPYSELYYLATTPPPRPRRDPLPKVVPKSPALE
jgi:hypothetical protein